MDSDTKSPTDGRSTGVQVIMRAARILRTLNGEHLGLTPSEVAARVDLSRSTVHRILVTLEGEGLVAAGATPGRYRLGPELTRLAGSERGELRYWVRPFLEQLSLEVNETVDLAVLIQDRVVFVDQIAAPRRLVAVSTVGATFPAHCTANGKALLATLSDEHLVRILPERFTLLQPNGAQTRDELMEELREVRRTGLAYDHEEHTAGISAIGSVVCDPFNAVAAVTVPLPSQRYDGNEERIAAALLRTCARISEMLSGGRSPLPLAEAVE
ncbi:MAG: IclR family transcriptional regulator [Sciscionella sp.]